MFQAGCTANVNRDNRIDSHSKVVFAKTAQKPSSKKLKFWLSISRSSLWSLKGAEELFISSWIVCSMPFFGAIFATHPKGPLSLGLSLSRELSGSTGPSSAGRLNSENILNQTLLAKFVAIFYIHKHHIIYKRFDIETEPHLGFFLLENFKLLW